MTDNQIELGAVQRYVEEALPSFLYAVFKSKQTVDRYLHLSQDAFAPMQGLTHIEAWNNEGEDSAMNQARGALIYRLVYTSAYSESVRDLPINDMSRNFFVWVRNHQAEYLPVVERIEALLIKARASDKLSGTDT